MRHKKNILSVVYKAKLAGIIKKRRRAMAANSIISEEDAATQFYVVIVSERGTVETPSRMKPGRPILVSSDTCGYFRGGECPILTNLEGDNGTLVGVLIAHATLYSESNGSRLWSCPVIVAGVVNMLLPMKMANSWANDMKTNAGQIERGRRVLRWRDTPSAVKCAADQSRRGGRAAKRRRKMPVPDSVWSPMDPAPLPTPERAEHAVEDRSAQLDEWILPVVLC